MEEHDLPRIKVNCVEHIIFLLFHDYKPFSSFNALDVQIGVALSIQWLSSKWRGKFLVHYSDMAQECFTIHVQLYYT